MAEERRRGFLGRMSSGLPNGEPWRTSPGRIEAEHGPAGEEPTPENFTMMQGFEWYVPDDHKHYKRLEWALSGLKSTGVDNVWIPPACKASSPSGNGYDIYDLYDLGEFNAKGSIGTKWGTKEELLSLCSQAHKIGVGIYFDAVLNHKAAADHVEKCRAIPVDSNGA